MINRNELSDQELYRKIKNYEICYGGNLKLKIFGLLSCKSGKRMNTKNQVFFISNIEALELGYRPCGNCMKVKYKNWKKVNGSF